VLLEHELMRLAQLLNEDLNIENIVPDNKMTDKSEKMWEREVMF
jgi:hypothetical protein